MFEQKVVELKKKKNEVIKIPVERPPTASLHHIYFSVIRFAINLLSVIIILSKFNSSIF